MSQITRCPSCATLFRVVPDQLRISDGWVRCGHCQEVFDATLSLQDTSDPVLSPGSGAQEHAPGAAAVGFELSSSAAQSASADAVLAASAALLTDTEPAEQSTEIPVDDTTHDAEKVQAEGQATEGATTTQWPAALTETDIVLEQVEASIQRPQPAGYELPAALLTDSDGEEERFTEEAGDDEFPLNPTLPAEPQKSSPGSVAAAWQPPYTPEFKAASLPQEGTDPEFVKVFSASPNAVKAEKAPSNHIAHHRSTSTADAANRVQATRSVRNNEVAPEMQVLAEMPEQDPVPLLSDVQHEPSFVRSARRKAVWHRPAVRLALGAFVLLLIAVLLLQIAVQQRHYLASAQPRWQPALKVLCMPLQCDVQPYQDIASVVVDSSAFNRLSGNTYRFALALKNQSGVPVALPAVELTLTDTSDQPLLRRVLTSSEMAAPAALPAGGEWSGSLEVEVALADGAAARISGYRVLVFYP